MISGFRVNIQEFLVGISALSAFRPDIDLAKTILKIR